MTDPEQSLAAFRRLVCAILDHPDELRVDVNEGDGYLRIDASWAAEPDQGKLVGEMGTHARALWFVLQTMGERVGGRWQFKVRFPERTGPRPPKGRNAERPAKHSHEADLVVLIEVVDACLGQPLAVAAHPEGQPGDVCFRIVPSTRESDTVLREQVEFHNRQTTLVAELGTLFRAIGRRQGVNYRVEVAP
jgi:predicted RNA-binding protein YlqC (UPF0109 family)